jgi:hypothetical protein
MGENERITTYMQSVAGKLARYRVRRRRKLTVLIDDVEPRSKNMPAADKAEFQRQVAETLSDFGRSAFRGGIALQLGLQTTYKTPPHAHSIAKNLLDLLGRQGPTDKNWQKTRLYKDDAQINALSVSCVHGQAHPLITIGVRPLATMIDDVELAAAATRALVGDGLDEREREQDWIESFRRLINEEAVYRERSGDDLYEAMVKMERFYSQHAFLGSSAITIPVLGWLYGRPNEPFMQPLAEPWPSIVRQTSVRIQLGDPPSHAGDSSAFKQKIDEALKDFETRWGWLISPLVVPVGLQVVVQPNSSAVVGTQNDLDNMVRDYLLPRIVPKFGTVTDHKWTIDFEEMKRAAPDVAKLWGASPLPPKGTKNGVTGYEVWRLPPAPAGQPGFVSVAMTAQPEQEGDLMQQVDVKIRRWAELLDEGSNVRRRFSRLR